MLLINIKKMTASGPSVKSGCREEKPADVFRGVFIILHPPPHSLRKITDHMIQHVLPRNIRSYFNEFISEDLFQIFLKIVHEYFTALTGKYAAYVPAAVPYMIKHMCDFFLQILL